MIELGERISEAYSAVTPDDAWQTTAEPDPPYGFAGMRRFSSQQLAWVASFCVRLLLPLPPFV